MSLENSKYCKVEYWNERYLSEEEYDWLGDYKSLRWLLEFPIWRSLNGISLLSFFFCQSHPLGIDSRPQRPHPRPRLRQQHLQLRHVRGRIQGHCQHGHFRNMHRQNGTVAQGQEHEVDCGRCNKSEKFRGFNFMLFLA